jgi:hypothetical protein
LGYNVSGAIKKADSLGRCGRCSLSLCENVLDACRVCQMVEERRYLPGDDDPRGDRIAIIPLNVLAYAVGFLRKLSAGRGPRTAQAPRGISGNGRLSATHPTIGRGLARALVAAGNSPDQAWPGLVRIVEA